MEAAEMRLDEEWADVKPIPGIHGVHCIRCKSPYTITYSSTSHLPGEPFTFKTNVCADDSITVVMQQSSRSAEEHATACSISLATFEHSVADRGYVIHGNTPSDGNCLFWPVSDQLEGHDICHTHMELRCLTADQVSNRSHTEKRQLRSFLVEPVDQYITKLRKDGVYADHIAIQALCKVLGSRITILHTYPAHDLCIGDDGLQLTLGYLADTKHCQFTAFHTNPLSRTWHWYVYFSL